MGFVEFIELVFWPILMVMSIIFSLNGGEMNLYLKRREIPSPKQITLTAIAFLCCAIWATITFNLIWRYVMFLLKHAYDDKAGLRIKLGSLVGLLGGLASIVLSHFAPTLLLLIQSSLVGYIVSLVLIASKSGGLVPLRLLWPVIMTCSGAISGFGLYYIHRPVGIMQICQAINGCGLFSLLYAGLRTENLLYAFGRIMAIDDDFVISTPDRCVILIFFALSGALVSWQKLDMQKKETLQEATKLANV